MHYFQSPSIVLIRKQNSKTIVFFGVIDQSKMKLDFSKSNIANQISYLHIDPADARGPCWARAMAQTLMNDESYFLQIDSHTVFEKDWDEYLLNYLKIIKKIIISQSYQHIHVVLKWWIWKKDISENYKKMTTQHMSWF